MDIGVPPDRVGALQHDRSKVSGTIRQLPQIVGNARGMKMFGMMDLSSGFDGCRFAIGLRNSHDKSFGSAAPLA